MEKEGVDLKWGVVVWNKLQKFGTSIGNHPAPSGRQPSVISQVTAGLWHSSPNRQKQKIQGALICTRELGIVGTQEGNQPRTF